MANQLSLFDSAPDTTHHLSRVTDPATSHVAAERKVVSGSASSDRAKILAVLRESGESLTGGEIAMGCGWGFDNARAMRRMNELERAGLVVKTGERTCRSKGSNQGTYRATGRAQDRCG